MMKYAKASIVFTAAFRPDIHLWREAPIGLDIHTAHQNYFRAVSYASSFPFRCFCKQRQDLS